MTGFETGVAAGSEEKQESKKRKKKKSEKSRLSNLTLTSVKYKLDRGRVHAMLSHTHTQYRFLTVTVGSVG